MNRGKLQKPFHSNRDFFFIATRINHLSTLLFLILTGGNVYDSTSRRFCQEKVIE